MGLISSEDSTVGTDFEQRSGDGWTEMFVSQRSFWQLDARIFLFTLSPALSSPFPSSSPYPSRPTSPSRESHPGSPRPESVHQDHLLQGLWSPATSGPFTSGSHLPTFYPPPPTQFVMTNNARHPLRPKPPRQGETFYTRYVPSLGQYLSFRTVSLSPKSPAHHGPVSCTAPSFLPPNSAVSSWHALPTVEHMSTTACDTKLLHNWMNDPRVSAAWGVPGPIETQEAFLKKGLSKKHSFPVIGCWDGKPFGYFEIYWVKEDQLGRYISGGDVGSWDRGIHVLVGEQEFRGKERVKVWLSALVHYCWLADPRTERVFAEPRADQEK
jgi:RimJ/RimL family protein N-acetyltransferase